MLGDMLSLLKEFPQVHEEFIKGNFAAQLLENLSKSETDKVIEMKLNKETKMIWRSSRILYNIGNYVPFTVP